MKMKHDDLLIINWITAVIGSTMTEPVLSTIAYIGSIIGSAVYIYTTLKRKKD